FAEELLTLPRLLTLRGQLVFLVETRSFGEHPGLLELWKTDGTVAGTGKLLDLAPLVDSITSLHLVGDELYFVAYSSGLQIWRTDGTAAGTRQILGDTLGIGEPFRFARAGSSVVFFAQAPNGSPTGRLWRTDGTAEGTSYVVDIPHHAYASNVFSEPISFQGVVYFFTDAGYGRHALWRSDGTGLGTKMVRD